MVDKVIQIAREAGEITLKYYKKDYAVHEKKDRSLLTKADLEANAHIEGALRSLWPNIPIISEEAAIPAYEKRKDWSQFWLVDPLDGTAEFVDHLDEYTVNIALIKNGEPVLGVVLAPAKALLYYSQKGSGAWKTEANSQPRQIFSKEITSQMSLTLVESRRHGKSELDEFLQKYQIKIGNRVSVGSSLKFCYVAEGVADIYPRMGPTMEWDVAAGDCIFRNSGRSEIRGSTLTYNKVDLKNGPFVVGLNLGDLK